MTESLVSLAIADPQAAIRYLGEMQARPMDPIHEPIQNLLDEDARRIEIELDAKRRQIRVRGDARPIRSVEEARRILTSICASKKVGKLGEKGVGMLSFVTVGASMTTLSQCNGRVVWFSLDREDLASGKVGSAAGNRLPYAGTETRIKGISARNMKYRFATERVLREVKRRWSAFITNGVEFTVNGRDVGSFSPPMEGETFERLIRVRELGEDAVIHVSLLLLKEPSELATVSVTHRGQANFLISDVALFDGHNAFTQGMVHGTISGDIAPINASRVGFQETRAFEVWLNHVLDVEEELGRLIEARLRAAAEARNASMLDEWMRHLREVFRRSELASASTGTQANPNIRVVRERRAFRINVNHPDFVLASKQKGGSRKYIRELCMHEAYIYSLEGKQRDWYTDRADEFLGYWTRAFLSSGRG